MPSGLWTLTTDSHDLIPVRSVNGLQRSDANSGPWSVLILFGYPLGILAHVLINARRIPSNDFL